MSHQDTNKAKSCDNLSRNEFIAAIVNTLLLEASDPVKQPCADESHGWSTAVALNKSVNKVKCLKHCAV